mmetsp:Transcript_3121/g.13531  ORF Transcript_3121/g.13531 Transcript_3121/m.13531 type:complete len:231 (+) Transcript_3121:5495-6187(+)
MRAPLVGLTASRHISAYSPSIEAVRSAQVLPATSVKHLFLRMPMKMLRPKMPKMVKKKMQNSTTLPIMGTDRMIVPMSVRIPGSTERVLSGRSTRITLSALALDPAPGSNDTREITTTMKSITFQPSLRYDPLLTRKPIATTFVSISSVNIVVKISSDPSMTLFPPVVLVALKSPQPLPSIFFGSIMQSTMAFARIVSRINLSNHTHSMNCMHPLLNGFSFDRQNKTVGS